MRTNHLLRRTVIAALALAWLAVGVSGAVGYWTSYDQHRGFAPVRLVRHSGHGSKGTVLFYSSALGKEYDYHVFLPAHYDPRKYRYPVFYLLHGSPGRPQVFFAIADIGVRLDNLIAMHKARPMILVFPDARIDGSTYSDSEWANTPTGHYESDVLDVLANVQHRFSVLRGRGRRVIGGLSMGAYGAMNIALHHLNLFEYVQAWSGYFRQTHNGVFAHASPAEMSYNSPVQEITRLVPELQRYPLNAYMFVGRGDHDSRQIRPMYRALLAAGATAAYRIYAGGHDWELWNAHVDGMLARASGEVGPPQPIRHAFDRARHHRSVRHHSLRGRHHRLRGHHRRHRSHRRRLIRFRLTAAIVPRRPPSRLSGPVLIAGLLLALVSAALINLGFLLQHQGLAEQPAASGLAGLRASMHNRTWLGGQALGWVGFIAQIAAVAIAPLSLVQAFAAGGLALSVPLAAKLFGQPISRSQLRAVLLIAAGLAVLPIAVSAVHDRLDADRLAFSAIVAVPAALVIACSRVGPWRAIAAGIFYGAADAAIKAVSVGWRIHGISAVWSGWTGLAVAATFLGFLAFQAALRGSGAVSSISVMNAFAAVVALACGLLAFGESLGHGTVAIVAHVVAIAVVLGCVRPLAAAQSEIVDAHAARAGG